MLNRSMREKVLELLEKEYNHTTTALKYSTPFQLLISTVLAAQSTDEQVNKITHDLYRTYPTAYDFARLTPEELEREIKSVGLYKNKAKNIVALSKVLVEKYNGKVPANRDELESLPGVGRKTANVVLSIAFRVPAIAVDTHVFRVSNRIGLANAKDVRKTEEQLMKNIPREKWSAAHHWLIWHGRKVCKARKPMCKECILQAYCEFATATGENPENSTD
jgi:endonuclease-3